VQNAGRAFWDAYELPLQKGCNASKGRGASANGAKDLEDQGQEENEREKSFREKRERRQKEQKEKNGGLLKMSEDLKGCDLYELLEVPVSASIDDIKKNYKRLVLSKHPDKMTNPTEEDTKNFIRIQEGFEILSDAQKRRRYDSSLSFDDTIPTSFPKGKPPSEFFEVFREVFLRNSRWSAKPRVPELGDENTPIDTVRHFYDFWHEFDSWRDPLAMAEAEEIEIYNLEEAECREERRWMERENAKVAKRLKQCERDRIADLVRLAEKHDPRMIAYRDQLQAQKDEEKARKAAIKEAERQRLEAAEKAREAALAEQLRIEEEKRVAERKVKEEQRAVLKMARQRLRGLHRDAGVAFRRAVHIDQLQEVCLRLDVDELGALSSEVEAVLAKAKSKAAGEDGQSEAIEVMHREILKCGATPIEDVSVKLTGESGDSTTSPDSSNDTDSDGQTDVVESPKKKERTPEEIEAERLRLEAQEAAEREQRERKAEEQRKRKEQQKKEEEKRLAAMKKQESKEREKIKKQAAKEEKQKLEEAERIEKQREQQLQQREAQLRKNAEEEAERKRREAEALVSHAFEMDRMTRLGILEKDPDRDFVSVITNTFLEGHEGAAHLASSLRRLAASMPSTEAVKSKKKAAPATAAPAGSKKAAAEAKALAEANAAAEEEEQARRQLEELHVDLGIACLALAQDGSDRALLSTAFAVAIRPPYESPELSKETKARVKKQRLRVRTAMLKILRQQAKPGKEDKAALPGKLSDLVASAAEASLLGGETATMGSSAELLWESFLSGFDMEAAAQGKAASVTAAEAPQAQQEEETAEPEAAPAEEVAPKAGKKGKKAAKQPAVEEDLDALLSEFGLEAKAEGKSAGKKKGKK